jgi:hypothetical protein
MNKCAVIVSRNDDYGGNLIHRATLCLNNLLQTFDAIFYIDWKCVNDKSLIESLPESIQKHPRLFTYKVTKQFIKDNIPSVYNIPIVEVLGRNLGIRKALDKGYDWICSTNIDIMINNFDIDILDKNILYSARRYNVPKEIHLESPSIDNLINNKGKFDKAKLAVIDGQAVWDSGDIWSLTVSCGDFQLAYRTLWEEVRGFEEEMVGRSYADSNLMKRPILIGKKSALLDTNIFHLNHGCNGYRESDEYLPLNDRFKYVNNFVKSTNTKDWGLTQYNL